jgi:hypothetical protein
MATNTGIPYEVLTQQIFQEILEQDSVRNVDVKQNVVLQGKTTSHQIDVYWKFEVGGIQYSAAVQTKDWSVPVNQGELIKFRGVLEDLPGQPRGIVVTRSGYQEGAATYARRHGILLYELAQEPDPPSEPITITDVGFAHIRIAGVTPEMQFIMETTVFKPVFSNLLFICDHSWLEEVRRRSGDDVVDEIASKRITALPRDVLLYDEAGTQIGTLRDLYARFAWDVGKEGCAPQEIKHTFEQPTFLQVPRYPVPRIKVVSLSVTLEVQKSFRRFISATNFVVFVLKSLDNGTVKRFHGPREALPKPERGIRDS